MKIKHLIATMVILVVLAAVLIYRARQGSNFRYAGTLDSTTTVISSKVAADLIDRAAVKEGSWVKKGQLIAVLDDCSYKIIAKQLDANFKRYTNLFSKGAATQADLESITRDKESNDLNINWCKIYAPIDGLVVTAYKEVGEYASVGSALYSLINPRDDIYAYFYVPHDMVCKLKVGDRVIGTLPELPERQFPGTIVKINEESEFTPKNVQTREERTRLVYGVKVLFENQDLTLKCGMTIETDFEST